MWHFMLILLHMLFLVSLVLVGCAKSKDPGKSSQRPVVYAKTTPSTRVILPAPSSGSETEKELENAEKKVEEKDSKVPPKAQNGKDKNVSEESSEKRLKPKIIPRTQKEEWIAKMKVTRKKNDYPTVDDVLSDWGDESKSQKKNKSNKVKPLTEQKKQ